MKQKDILLIIVPLFILTVLWVMFTIYHNYTTSTIQDPLSIQIVPIEGTFDTKTLDALKQRQSIEPDYESAKSATVLSPTPTTSPENEDLSPEEIASESAIQNPGVIQEGP
jgi:YbbR domain-containing protein